MRGPEVLVPTLGRALILVTGTVLATRAATEAPRREHRSGHRFPITYWEVLNEPDFEHRLTEPQYTRIWPR
jgi:hypothetical protein